MSKAVAVDLGASSARFAVGSATESGIKFEIVEQIAHSAIERNGVFYWDIEALLSFTRRAAEYAASVGAATIGIDSWGVDHGFLDHQGNLLQAPVCYRDPSHVAAFESLAAFRPELYRLTGIQHQPFDTICQLVARRTADPSFVDRAKEWMILPDLLGYLLTGERFMELTQASTTQLMGLDGRWSQRAFELAGWPVPALQPERPGGLGAQVLPGVRLAHVGSHDTASAVCGFGALNDEQAFLNMGTWSLLGCTLNDPLATPKAEAAGFTNERTVDGRVRFLKNIPGFYVVNRLHEELGITGSVGTWLSGASLGGRLVVDLSSPEFFNPVSMVETCSNLLPTRPSSKEAWADVALGSMVEAVAKGLLELSVITGRRFSNLRVGGGGSQSAVVCQALSDRLECAIHVGPSEATVLGNLGMQFLASGELGGFEEVRSLMTQSAELRSYAPGVKP